MTTNIYGRLPDINLKQGIISAKNNTNVFGVRYPLFDKDNKHKGIFRKSAGIDLLKSEVSQFIQTERGERVMLPNFGLSLKKYLFEPMTTDLKRSIHEEIVGGISSYLRNVVIKSIQIQQGDNITGLGLPGIVIQLVISPKNSSQQALVQVKL